MSDSVENLTAALCREITHLAAEIPTASRTWHARNAVPARIGEPVRSIGRASGHGDPTAATAAWLTQARENNLQDLKTATIILRRLKGRLVLKERAHQPEIRRCQCGNLAPDRRHPETREPECESCYGRRRRAAKAGR